MQQRVKFETLSLGESPACRFKRIAFHQDVSFLHSHIRTGIEFNLPLVRSSKLRKLAKLTTGRAADGFGLKRFRDRVAIFEFPGGAVDYKIQPSPVCRVELISNHAVSCGKRKGTQAAQTLSCVRRTRVDFERERSSPIRNLWLEPLRERREWPGWHAHTARKRIGRTCCALCLSLPSLNARSLSASQSQPIFQACKAPISERCRYSSSRSLFLSFLLTYPPSSPPFVPTSFRHLHRHVVRSFRRSRSKRALRAANQRTAQRSFTTANASGINTAAADDGALTSTVTVAIKAGSRYESAPGVAHVLKNYLFKSNQKRSALRLVREAEFYGGVLSTALTKEHLLLTAEFLRGDEEFFVEVLGAMF